MLKTAAMATGGGAAIAMASGIIGNFAGDAIGAASSTANAMSKVEAVFGSSNDVIKKFAAEAVNDIGMSEKQVLQATGTFGNFFSQVGMGDKEVAGLSTTMVKMAADFAAFHDADPTQVIEAQTAAFRGEYDALQRFVPMINAAAVEQKAMTQTGKESAEELTAREKAMAAVALMTEGMGKAQGAAAREADSLSGRQLKLDAAMDNLSATMGKSLMPIATEMAGVGIELAQALGDILPAAIAVAKPLVEGLVLPFKAVAAGIRFFKELLGDPVPADGVKETAKNVDTALKPIPMAVETVANQVPKKLREAQEKIAKETEKLTSEAGRKLAEIAKNEAEQIAEASAESAEKIARARRDAAEKIVEAQQDSESRLTEAQRQFGDRMIEAGAAASQRIAAAEREAADASIEAKVDAGRRLVVAEAESAEQMGEAAREAGQRLATAQRDAADRMAEAQEDSRDRLREAQQKFADEQRTAVTDAGDKIAEAHRDAKKAIEDAITGLTESRSQRGEREQFREIQEAAERAREIAKEEAEAIHAMKRDLEKAKTAEERKAIEERFADAKADRERRRGLEAEDRAFRQAQAKAQQAFDDRIEDEQLKKRVAQIKEGEAARVSETTTALQQRQAALNAGLAQEAAKNKAALAEKGADVQKALGKEREQITRSQTEKQADLAAALTKERKEITGSLALKQADVQKALAKERATIAATLAEKQADLAKAHAKEKADLIKAGEDKVAEIKKSLDRQVADERDANAKRLAEFKKHAKDEADETRAKLQRQITDLQKELADKIPKVKVPSPDLATPLVEGAEIARRDPKVARNVMLLGNDISTGVGVGIAKSPSIVDSLLGALGSAWAAARKWIEGRSPSQKFARDVGVPIAQGIAIGIERRSDDVSKALGVVLRDAKTASSDAMQHIAANKARALQDILSMPKLDGRFDKDHWIEGNEAVHTRGTRYSLSGRNPYNPNDESDLWDWFERNRRVVAPPGGGNPTLAPIGAGAGQAPVIEVRVYIDSTELRNVQVVNDRVNAERGRR